MTQQVRTSYRNHRKATWGIVLAIAVAITALVIPIASGNIATGDDSYKTYTLGFAPGSTLTKTLCNDATNVVLTLTNTAKYTTLGSAEITFPSFATVASSGLTVTPSGAVSLDTSKNKVKLRSLGLSKGQAATITVPFSALGAGGPTKLVTVVKKTSNFSGDDDDVFSKAPAPELTVAGCATISGRVFQDRNGSLAYDATGSPPDAPLAWDVYLYKKVGTTYQLGPKVTAGSDGNFTFTGVLVGKDYRLCVRATGTADLAQAWALVKPTTNSNCSSPKNLSPPSDATSAANEITGLSGTVGTGQDFAVVPVTAPVACGGGSSVTDYVVQLGNDASASTSKANCSKATVRYVQERFADGGTIYFNFTPAPGTSTGKVLLVEELEATFDLSKGQSTVLKYDDTAPFTDYQPMPFCLVDPREAPATNKLLLKSMLVEGAVLPPGHTSCLIETHENVGPTGKFTRTDYVFSAVDGSRGMG